MQLNVRQRYWMEVGGLALAAVLFFRFGLLLLVFLVPIQIAWVRRGEQAGLAASGIFLGALALLKGTDYLRVRGALGASSGAGLLFLDIVLPAAFLAGLYLLNSPGLSIRLSDGSRRELHLLERMIAAVLAAAAIYVPVIVLVGVSGSVNTMVAAQVELLRSLLQVTEATEQELRALTEMVLRIFLSGFVFGFFVMLVANWWIGTRLGLRERYGVSPANDVRERLESLRIVRFRLPVTAVWVLIAAWGAVLGSLLVDVGWLSFVIWNLAFLTLGIYAIQGLAIVWHFLDRRKVQRNARVGIAAALVFGMLVPGLNLVFLLGLPGLGISEVWVDYHRFERGGEEK